jgi:NDP-sugar pyrophosphorylase family protein
MASSVDAICTDQRLRQAVILAGDEAGDCSLIEELPGALVPVAGRAMLDWQLDWLAAQAVRHVVVACSRRADAIVDHLSDRRDRRLEISVAVRPKAVGPGGALRHAAQGLEWPAERWLALKGTIMTRFSLAALLGQHIRSGATATVAVAPFRTRLTIASVDDCDRVTGFAEAPVLPYWVSAGVYCFEPEVAQLLPERGDHEDSTFRYLAAEQRMSAYRIDGFWRSVDTIEDLADTAQELTLSPW